MTFYKIKRRAKRLFFLSNRRTNVQLAIANHWGGSSIPKTYFLGIVKNPKVEK